ncbi:MAG: hypothetical protein ACRYGK_12025 [Janthinobacterium lividum]
MSSYDKEIFIGVSVITILANCNHPLAALGLSTTWLEKPFDVTNSDVHKSVVLPQSWQTRVSSNLQKIKLRAAEFFKLEGEKALRTFQVTRACPQSANSYSIEKFM